MTTAHTVALIGIGICAAGSFFCALAESALFSLGKWRAQQLTGDSSAFAQDLSRLLREPQDLLAATALGSTVANAAIVAIALGVGLTGGWPLSAAVAGALLLILIAGEVVPKTLAVRAPERWARRLAWLVVWLKRATTPVRRLGQWFASSALRAITPKGWQPQTTLSDDEYQELLEMAYQQGTLARAERDLIVQIVRLDRRTAKDVMKPRLKWRPSPTICRLKT